MWTVVVAAGSGSRVGGEVPKQFLTLGGVRVVDRAVATAAAVSDGVVLVLPPGKWEANELATRVVAGGATRSASVRAGLAAVPETAEVVVVHDAARPLASAGLFERVVSAVLAGADAAVPGLESADTLKEVDPGGTVVATLPRERVVAVQTPQAFKASVLREAHRGEPEFTDDAAAVEAIGCRVVVVPGERLNLKITVPEDLRVAECLVS
ncbi:MAG: hypothetical protein KatS3mg008_1573 [Acidimicrobiales bacterium]|nr:MAG: hypothetical protein KatS3mg008_1573 [Acidimicrobiales bacterium]